MFRRIMISKFHKQWAHETIKCLYALLPCSPGPSRDPQSPFPPKQKSEVSQQLSSVRQSAIRSFRTCEYCASVKHDYLNLRSCTVRVANNMFFIRCFPSRSVITYKYNTSVDNTTLYLYTKNSIFCQGDMFRPYKVVPRPSKKTNSRVVYVLRGIAY